MKTMTRPFARQAGLAPRSDAPPEATRAVEADRTGWSSQFTLTREAASAIVWAVFPAVLGGAVEGLAAGRPSFAVLAVIIHQLVAVVLGGRADGQRSVWGAMEWSILAAGASLTIAVAAPALWPWLLLPIGPALLLRAARQTLRPQCASGLMRIFSVATLGAVLVQLASGSPTAGVAVAVLGGTVLYLAGVERLTSGRWLR